MTQQATLRRCQQCDNLVTRLFPIRPKSGHQLRVCAGCYGLGLAQLAAERAAKLRSAKTSD